MTVRVVAPVMAERMAELWHVAMDLYALQPEGWTIIGGQMASLHSWERGMGDARPTQDLDAGLHYRQVPRIGIQTTAALQRFGFSPEQPAPDAPVVRWKRDGWNFDVLVPVNPRVPPVDVNGSRLLQSHGVQQALDRTELVLLVIGDREGLVPRPTLFGSIIGKAAAFSNDGDQDKTRHGEDLAVLLTMLQPDDVRTTIRPRDMQHLRRANAYLLSDTSPVDSPELRASLRMIFDAYGN